MSNESATPAKPSLLFKTRRARFLALVVLIAAGGAMAINRGQAQPGTSAAGVQPEIVTAEQSTSQPQATRRAPATTRRTNRASAAKSTEPMPARAPVADISELASRPSAVASPSAREEVAATEAAVAQEPPAIQIIGCLERENDKFRLKDTEGEDAPRSRSWKAGFLKRSNRAVDIVDVSNRFNLADHVGERISATGALVDGDMQLHSLSRVASSCKGEV